MNLLQRGALKLIEGYRVHISPYKKPCCRYYPTCSAYGMEAIRLHGFFKGGLLTVWRILRCNPFSKGGVDPVPGSELAKRRAAEAKAGKRPGP